MTSSSDFGRTKQLDLATSLFFVFLSLSFLFESQLSRSLGVSTLFIFSLTHEISSA